jgi:hypothetical protein
VSYTACTISLVASHHNPDEGRVIINNNFGCISNAISNLEIVSATGSTSVTPGTNIDVNLTILSGIPDYTVSVIDNPIFTSLSATSISASTFFSGSTPLELIFSGVNLWSASTGANSIIANNGSGNVAGGRFVIVGGNANIVTGDYSFIGGGLGNSVTTKYSSVLGGKQNLTSGAYSFIGGGQQNISFGNSSFVGGGFLNKSLGVASFAGGGFENSATTDYSTIVGGYNNLASGNHSFVGGGKRNKATGLYSFVGGGLRNIAVDGSLVVGGRDNTSSAPYSIVIGGKGNFASANFTAINGGYANTANTAYAIVIGGYKNIASGNKSFIGGGGYNVSSGYGSAIVGGINNLVSGYKSFVGGGSLNTASTYFSSVLGGLANAASSFYSTVGGGHSNLASGSYSTIGGGYFNLAYGIVSVVAGGQLNSATTQYSSVLGGKQNLASGLHSAVLNGSGNTASGNRSAVIGGQNINGSASDTVYMPNARLAEMAGTVIYSAGTDLYDIFLTNGGSSYTNQFFISATSINNYTGSATTALTAYSVSDIYLTQFENSNTITGTTLNIDGLGAFDLLKGTDEGLAPLEIGEIQTGVTYFLTYDGTQFQFFTSSPEGTPGTYTNLSPATVAVGGITVGTTFSGATWQSIFDTMFHPTLTPNFTAFSLRTTSASGSSIQTQSLEVGNSVSGGSKAFTWTTSNSSFVNPASIRIYSGATNISVPSSGMTNDSYEALTLTNTRRTTQSSFVWYAYGTRTNNSTFSSSFTVNWYWRRMYGVSTATTLSTSADINAFSGTGALTTSMPGTYVLNGAGYKYFFAPTTFANPSLFKDASTQLAVSMADATDNSFFSGVSGSYSYGTTSVTNQFGIAQNYRVYRTRNYLNGNITIIVS